MRKALAAGAAEGWRGWIGTPTLLPKMASATANLVRHLRGDPSTRSATPTTLAAPEMRNLVGDAVAAWGRWLRAPSLLPETACSTARSVHLPQLPWRTPPEMLKKQTLASDALAVWRRWLHASTRPSRSSSNAPLQNQPSLAMEARAPPPSAWWIPLTKAMASAVPPPPPHSSASWTTPASPSPHRALPPPPFSAAPRAKGCRAAASSASPSRGYSTNSSPPPEQEPEPERTPASAKIASPMPSHHSHDSCRDDRSLDICYSAKEFVKKYPILQFAHPKDTKPKFNRWVYQEWFKPTVRGLLKCVNDHHASNLEFLEITMDNVRIFCNPNAPQFIPQIKICCETRESTFEGRKRNYVQTGELIRELMKASVDNPMEVLDLLSEDIKDKLNTLKNPVLSNNPDQRYCGAYLLVNHPSMLLREMQSPFYLACYDLLMSVDEGTAEKVFDSLPYDNWKSRARQHPLLRKHLLNKRSNYGKEKTHLGRYRRNVPSHKTSRKSKYKAEDVDDILHLHFPMILTRLMKKLSKMNLLIYLTLHNFFG